MFVIYTCIYNVYIYIYIYILCLKVIVLVCNTLPRAPVQRRVVAQLFLPEGVGVLGDELCLLDNICIYIYIYVYIYIYISIVM